MPRERLFGYAFILPATLFICLFIYWPVVYTFYTSLHEASLVRPEVGEAVGAANYRALRADPAFAQAARNTALFTVLVVPGQTVLALLLAVWANGPGLRKRVLRLVVFIPTGISLVVLSVLWDLLYAPPTATGSGLINGLLGAAGLPTQPFLTSPAQALPAIAAMSVWQGTGLQMLIFLASLQQIDPQLYEQSMVDGAGPVQRFRHVTLPLILPTALFVVMITTIFALKLFAQPFIMTQGGPRGTTRSMVQYIYEAAFRQLDLGLACAAGTVFFVAVMAIAMALRWMTSRVEVRA